MARSARATAGGKIVNPLVSFGLLAITMVALGVYFVFNSSASTVAKITFDVQGLGRGVAIPLTASTSVGSCGTSFTVYSGVTLACTGVQAIAATVTFPLTGNFAGTTGNVRAKATKMCWTRADIVSGQGLGYCLDSTDQDNWTNHVDVGDNLSHNETVATSVTLTYEAY